MTDDQTDLFDVDQTTIARATDPITSHLAATEITRSGARRAQADAVLTLVRNHPGKTSAELADLGNVDRYMVARRLPEMRGATLTQGEPRVCGISQRQAVTWWPITNSQKMDPIIRSQK